MKARLRALRSPVPEVRSGPGTFDRSASLALLATGTYDVVVVGGGITGAGVALDAAARGLRVALLEAYDFASGTSSRSSKLVHGGLRYLQSREFRLVYGALDERQNLLRNAPHLVRPLPFLIPLFGPDGVLSAGLAKGYTTALWLYDLCGGLRIGHRHRRLDAAAALAHVPLLRTERLVASFRYWDAQADDARLTLAVVRSAAALGAVVANRVPVAAGLSGPDGRLTGVTLADGTEVRARVVVNAGGVWSAQLAEVIEAGAGAASAPTLRGRPIHLRPAKGVHMTVPGARLPCDHAVVLPVPGTRRSVFVVPWQAAEAGHNVGPGRVGLGRFTYVGTTDTDYHGPLDAPRCEPEDLAELLSAVNTWTDADLTPADVTAAWAGLRPLVEGEDDPTGGSRTADLSRRHRVLVSPSGMVTVTGGKLTTYRRMAAEAVDAAVGLLGRGPHRSPTRRLLLVGAEGWDQVPARGHLLGVPSIRAHLVGRHGADAVAVVALCDADPSLALPLVPGLPYLRAEALWAVRAEMAGGLADVLERRTRALMLDRQATLDAAPTVAALIGPELGWSDAEVEAEVAALIAANPITWMDPSPLRRPPVDNGDAPAGAPAWTPGPHRGGLRPQTSAVGARRPGIEEP